MNQTNVAIVNMAKWERIAGAAGGAALLASALTGRTPKVSAIAGAALAAMGISGYCPFYRAFGVNHGRRRAGLAVPYELGVPIEESVVIHLPADEIFAFWRDLSNLSRFMRNVERVEVMDDRRSRWTVRAPMGSSVSWEAEIHNEEPGRMIAWRSLPGSSVENAGSVSFRPLPGSATEVRVKLQYNPPAGFVGAAAAGLTGASPGRQVRQDLQELKRLLEGASSRRSYWSGPEPEGARSRSDEVQESSEQSFPASDPPSWTPERV
ncbi:MAG: SRPBCC family protein [Bryobacteraceae bacterium]|nr:SRPBCC family protein [Bryobacteraceae bacterium]